MRSFIHRLLLAITTGCIFYFYSELMFWAKYNPEKLTLGEVAATLGAYTFAAYLLLGVRSFFRAWSWPALFLCGAFYGWFIEGIVVQTMYDQFPMQIVWAGLSWHALLTVMFGWSLVPALLSNAPRGRLIWVCATVGVVYGLWAIWWWWTENAVSPPLEFFLYTQIGTVILIAAYWLRDVLSRRPFQPSMVEWVFLTGVSLLYFVFVAIPAAHMAAVVWPACAGLTFALLAMNRCDENVREPTHPPLLPRRLPALLLIPLTASFLYLVMYGFDARIPTGWAVYIITWLSGAGMFVYSAWIILRRKMRASQVM